MDQETVTLTDRAARRIARILAAEPAGTALRVSVEGGGCSGFQYRYDLVREPPATDDIVLARDGATVLIDSHVAGIYGRVGDRFRRRPDRPVLPDQEPARCRLLRLRHQLFDLGSAPGLPSQSLHARA